MPAKQGHIGEEGGWRDGGEQEEDRQKPGNQATENIKTSYNDSLPLPRILGSVTQE